MKLIVEAGSTKTDSVLIDKNGKVSDIVHSSGINPVSDPSYSQSIRELCLPYEQLKINNIFYYGSGCINSEVNETLAQEISQCINNDTTIEIQDDLLAVGRGLCQKKEGIIGILGTGSNIGYYDGNTVIESIPSCGYLLGDEGSGYKIGQEIYTRLARFQLNEKISKAIYEDRNITPDSVIPTLYQQVNPRKYLASFAVFIQQLNDGEKSEIIDQVFDSFIIKMIQPITKRRTVAVHLCGSVAFHFREELREKLRKFNNIASYYKQSPLEGLIRYHSHE